jgi:hypothetical protein
LIHGRAFKHGELIAMAEFEPDSESVSRADKLSSRLVRDLHVFSGEGTTSSERRRDFSSGHRYAEEAEGMRIDDVLENVDQIAREFSAWRRWDETVLCLDLGDGELAPISTFNFFTESAWGPRTSVDIFELLDRYGPVPFDRLRKEVDLRAARLFDDKVRRARIEEAEAGVRRGLRGFLSYRIAGLKMGAEARPRTAPRRSRLMQELRNRFFGYSRWAGSSGAPPRSGIDASGGLEVQVSCNTPGLRIHISPAYFISWVYFGSPTSPVTSYVLPGRYIFSGDGPMLPSLKFDPGVFSIPPDFRPSLVRF